MNDILIIGNGFDLAHDLPTTYYDFLCFVIYVYDKLFGDNKGIDCSINKNIESLIQGKLENHGNNLYSQIPLWKELLFQNSWIDYFMTRVDSREHAWVDIEEDIKNVLYEIILVANVYEHDSDEESAYSIWYCQGMCGCLNPKLPQRFQVSGIVGSKEWCEEVLYQLEIDLLKLERAFEIYIRDYVECIEIRNSLGVIRDICYRNILNKGSVKIFSFNYTDTPIRAYSFDTQDVFYIHGNIRTDLDTGSCNLVLGVDELAGIPKGLEKAFLPFQKFYRRESKGLPHDAMKLIRTCNDKSLLYDDAWKYVNDTIIGIKTAELIRTETGVSQKIESIIVKEQEEFRATHNKGTLYVFGHSLALSDREYFSHFLLNDYMETVIFYRDNIDRERLMRSLVIMIGNEEFRKRMSRGDISFRNQLGTN